jgi:hypothetical protein
LAWDTAVKALVTSNAQLPVELENSRCERLLTCVLDAMLLADALELGCNEVIQSWVQPRADMMLDLIAAGNLENKLAMIAKLIWNLLKLT